MIDNSLFLCILTLAPSRLITMKKTTLLTLLTLTLCVFGAEKEDKEKNIAASELTEAAWRANLKRKPEEILKQTGKCHLKTALPSLWTELGPFLEALLKESNE